MTSRPSALLKIGVRGIGSKGSLGKLADPQVDDLLDLRDTGQKLTVRRGPLLEVSERDHSLV